MNRKLLNSIVRLKDVSHKKAIQAVALVFISVCFCGFNKQLAKINNPNENKDGNFVLYVSNQSYEIKTVDILISIDDKPILQEDFNVGDQHDWKQFTLQIANGKHKIEAITRKGSTGISQQFDFTGKQWAVLYFCYSKREGNTCPIPELRFENSDRPIRFL